MPTALITGITGQDGSYLADLLAEDGYRIIGVAKPGSSTDRIAHLRDRIELRAVDLLDAIEVHDFLESVRPTEVYNLAGHTFVPTSWQRPELLGDVTAVGAARLLDAIEQVDPGIRFYQASSSELFGNAVEEPQSEVTPLNPRNPYGVAKAAAHAATIDARERRGLFAVSGILYNHESPRRGPEYVSRRITTGVARIALGLADTLAIGSLDAERDWGFAGDYVRAMRDMLRADVPSDYVIATGRLHTVRDLCRIAFGCVGRQYEHHVEVDPALVRPPEAVRLVGDASKAERELGWRPSITFEELIAMMVDADIELLRAAGAPPRA